jgi:molybdopterin biosynthesis enzyme
VLDVSVDALRQANMLDGICIYTLFHGQIVDAGEQVARAKVAPLVLAERLVHEAEQLMLGAAGLLRVRPFHPRRIGAVAAETLGDGAAGRIRAALAEKVSWFGSTLLAPAFVPPDAEALLAAMRDLMTNGAELLLVAGTKPMDPLDPCWLALRRFGVTIERFGVPAHPGSLFWIAWHGEIAILGLPTCGLFTQASVFDLILPRVLAGERLARADLAELGHGGFLTRELAFRFPPYRGGGRGRGEVEDE